MQLRHLSVARRTSVPAAGAGINNAHTQGFAPEFDFRILKHSAIFDGV